MARITLKELETIVAAYVDASKQAGTWSASTNNLAGLVDKVAKTVTIDGIFADKLPQLDGEELPLGKTIEEWYQDLGTIYDYSTLNSSDSATAQNALKPYYPSYEDVAYSYTLGKKVIPTTVQYNDYERACNSPAELASITSMVLKRLYDLEAQFRFDAKKQLIANFIAKCVAMQDSSTATAYTKNTTVVVRGTRYVASGVVALCVKSAAAAINKDLSELIAEGEYMIAIDMVESLAIPTDTTTGEAFIKSVKGQVENAEFASQGHSLNGAAIGASEGLLLIMKKGIRPVLEVEVEAGAFNPGKLAVPAEIVYVDNFGSDSNKAYAMLVDRRAMRLHPTYKAVRENLNGVGDFVNYFMHEENTAFISKACFVHVWKEVEE